MLIVRTPRPQPTSLVRPSARIPAALAFLALLILPALSAAPAAAQQQRSVVAEDLYRLRLVSDVAVSPDGRSVAYSVSRADSADNRYLRDLWLASTDGSEPRRLTYTGEASESSPAFSPDGRHLAFVSRRADDDVTTIYVLPLAAPGEARPLASPENGAGAPVWSPDGRRIAFSASIPAAEDTADLPGVALDSAERAAAEGESADRPLSIREKLARNAAEDDPRVVTRLDYLTETSVRTSEDWRQIHVIDAFEEGAEPEQITSGAFHHGGPSWSPDGASLLYNAAPPRGDYHPDYERDSDIFVIAADGSGEPRALTGGDRQGEGPLPTLPVEGDPAPWSEYGPSYSPGGEWIAYIRRTTGAHSSAANSELMVMRANGSDARCLSCDLDRGLRGYGWDSDADEIFFTVGDHGSVPLHRVSAEGGEPRVVVSGPRGVLSFDVAGGTIAWSGMQPDRPSDLYAADVEGEGEQRLTAVNDSLLAAVHVQPYEELWYSAPDGAEIQGWVVRPPEEVANASSSSPPPLALEMHGGPHAMWGPGEQSMWLEYQMLAGAGYTVFLSNPRGSGGYGFEFKRVIHRDWGDLPMGDVLAGADTVLARGWADPDRQTITGGSYAGFLTAWIIGRTDRFDAAVSQRGVYDMAGWYAGSNTWRLFESEFGTFPWREPMLAWEASPMSLVEEITTPLLLIHGERDYRTTIATAEAIYRALKVLDRPVEFVRYPREGHELSRSGEPHHRVDRLLRILEFFERHVGEGTPLDVEHTPPSRVAEAR